MNIELGLLVLSGLCAGALLFVAVLSIVIARQNREADLQDGAPQSNPGLEALQPRANTTGPTDLSRRIEAMLRAGDKAGAIRIFQETTGVGLRAASDAVEKIEKQIYREQFVRADPNLRAQLIELLKHGRRMDAVRLYATENQVGFTEASQAVEALYRSLTNN